MTLAAGATKRAAKGSSGPPLDRTGRRTARPSIAAALKSLLPRDTRVDEVDGRLLSATFAVDLPRPFDPIGLFAAALQANLEPCLWLQPSDGLTLVGIGRAWSAEAEGPDRFRAVAEAWQRRLADARFRSDSPAVRGVGPLLIGGLGFAGETPRDPAWAPFGPSAMVLPELLVSQSRAGSWLTASFVARAGQPGPGPSASGSPDDVERLWTRLVADVTAGSGSTEAGRSGRVPLSIVAERPDRATWDRLVGRFAGAVGRGRLDKVVLARRVDLAAPVEIDVVAALRGLAAGSPTSTTYAIVRAGSVFLGATPERLIATRGTQFQTVAIAGSIRLGRDATEAAALAAELLASEKDREEHEIVVAMLRRMFEPLATEIVVAAEPTVARFGSVQHLVTPVTGRLRERVGILDLAGSVHPTPAVGGEPRALALALIAEHEGFERGWYAGPLGWVGADGDGEFVVALRCGVVSGRSATLFVGCGIVADSDPAREWEESRTKMQVVASALGELQS